MPDWTIGATITYPAETADALEDYVAYDLASELEVRGVPAELEAVLAELDEMDVNPLLISQCLNRVMNILKPEWLRAKAA